LLVDSVRIDGGKRKDVTGHGGGRPMNLSFGEVQTFVSDLEVARKFYVDTLGLKLVKATEKWLILDVSGKQFILMAGGRPVERLEAYGAECATVLCLLTDDIHRDYAALKAGGVRFFSEVNKVDEGEYVAFQDPDGNLLELIQQ
jgi:catechol 2,3-dioxygenase-like lactoylglutathione lyase family enzyme